MIRAGILFLAAVALAAFAACGGGDDDDGPSATSSNPSIVPGAQQPMHISDVTPKHGQAVTNEELAVGDDNAVSGICVRFEFQEGDGMGETPTSLVQMFLNNEDVSGSLNWVTTDDLPTSSGNGCYGPPEPLLAGVANVRVRYADSTGRQFEYPWQFEVTE